MSTKLLTCFPQRSYTESSSAWLAVYTTVAKAALDCQSLILCGQLPVLLASRCSYTLAWLSSGPSPGACSVRGRLTLGLITARSMALLPEALPLW